MKHLRLADITSKLVGAPYKLGGHGVNDGFDCYSLFVAICDFWGVKAPDKFGDLTIENYPERFKTDPDGTKEILFKALADKFTEINPNRAFVGDVLITTVKGGSPDKFGLGIYAGNDSMVAAYLEKGVMVMPLRAYNIIKAYRIV